MQVLFNVNPYLGDAQIGTQALTPTSSSANIKGFTGHYPTQILE